MLGCIHCIITINIMNPKDELLQRITTVTDNLNLEAFDRHVENLRETIKKEIEDSKVEVGDHYLYTHSDTYMVSRVGINLYSLIKINGRDRGSRWSCDPVGDINDVFSDQIDEFTKIPR